MDHCTKEHTTVEELLRLNPHCMAQLFNRRFAGDFAMNYCCYTVSGKKSCIIASISVQINVHEDAPADDMTVIFPLIEQVPKIATIRVWNGEKPIFSGIIDEQIMGVTKNGAMLKLIARSRGSIAFG